MCIFGCEINALVVPFNSLQAPYVDQVLHKGSEAISIMSVSIMSAMAIGMIFIPKLKDKLGGGKLFIAGGIIVGITYCLLSVIGKLDDGFIYAALCMDTVVMGFGVILLNFPLQVSMLKRVPDEYLGRVASLFNGMALCAVPIASCVIGILTDLLSVGTLYMIFGLAVAVMFLLQVLNKYIREFDEY